MSPCEPRELYARYCQARESLGGQPRLAEFDNAVGEAALSPIAGQFEVTAGQHLRDLASITNEFVYNYRKLKAWLDVLPDLDLDETSLAMLEFVDPVAYFCLGAPAALKGRHYHSIALVSHLANETLDSDWVYDDDLGRSGLDTARQHAKNWRTWRKLRHCVGALDDGAFRASADGFRNDFHHGSPRLVEVGTQKGVARVRPGVQVTYFERAIPLASVTEALNAQVDAAVNAHDAFRQLVEEQWRVVGG